MIWNADEVRCFYRESANKYKSLDIIAQCNGCRRSDVEAYFAQLEIPLPIKGQKEKKKKYATSPGLLRNSLSGEIASIPDIALRIGRSQSSIRSSLSTYGRVKVGRGNYWSRLE